jgi:hypothetical protein
MFGYLCNFAHPNIRGMRGNLILEPSKFDVRFVKTPLFHESTSYALIIELLDLSTNSIELFYDYFKKFNNLVMMIRT